VRTQLTIMLALLLSTCAAQDRGAAAAHAAHVCTDLDGNIEPCQPVNDASAPAGQDTGRQARPVPQRSRWGSREGSRIPSSYVPLDSWVYPALVRLAGLGYVRTAALASRPWTRIECARLLSEAQDRSGPEMPSYVASLLPRLVREFEGETRSLESGDRPTAAIDSVYVRAGDIAGDPLTDGFHFAQTVTDDFGRPYGRGPNSASGASLRGSAGPFAFYVRGEYQSSAAPSPMPASAIQAIATADSLPAGTNPGPAHRGELLDSYITLNIAGWQLTVGKQSLWWSPDSDTALILSNNAAPIPMLRASQVSPAKLPSILGWLGLVHTDFFFGYLEGYHYVRGPGPDFTLVGEAQHTLNPQPFIYGSNWTFSPTPNLQFGVTLTTVFAGKTRPLTFGTFLHTFSLSGNGQAVDPGDRRSGFTVRYALPGLRDRVILYNDAMTEDEPSPIVYPQDSAMAPGIYLPRCPGLARLDFRAEGVYTDLPGLHHTGYFYSNFHYAEGYRNDGQLIGSWIGRQGRGFRLSSTYWHSADRTLTFAYRHERVNADFLEGGVLDDVSARSDIPVGNNLLLSASAQFERWNFPLLSNLPRNNVAVSLEFTYSPQRKVPIGKR
jgi:capsule assembly protein Wzi